MTNLQPTHAAHVEQPERAAAWSDVFARLTTGTDLSELEASWAMQEVMSGRASAGQIGGLLVGLRAKGESATEVASFVDAMLDHAVAVQVPAKVVDTCGTGGDASGTVNISTMAAVVVAACGVPVVKHGNRAATSKSGSADLLEALGVAIDLDGPAVQRCVEQVGIGFCFAPVFHPAMKYAGPVRRDLGVPTVFNVLGPLANPARPGAQLVGVADVRRAPVVADALARRGTDALVVRGSDGLDELTLFGPSEVWLVRDGQVHQAQLDPTDLGIPEPPPGALAGGHAAENAEIARDVFAGLTDGTTGAVRDAVALNAAAAMLAHAGPTGEPLADQIAPHFESARHALAEGAAAQKLQRWVEVSTSQRSG